jgi:hypothetical protein
MSSRAMVDPYYGCRIGFECKSIYLHEGVVFHAGKEGSAEDAGSSSEMTKKNVWG